MRRFPVLLPFALCLGLGLTGEQSLSAQREPAWVEQAPLSARPEARWGHGMAYDPVTGTTILVGGRDAGGTYFDGYWVWQPFHPSNPVPPRTGSWTRRSPGTRPAPRVHPAVAGDGVDTILLFGGRRGSTRFNDTWYYKNSTGWGAPTIAAPPPQRCLASLAFDSARSRYVLFGGLNNSTPLADTWEFDGRDWIPRFPAAFPSPRHGAAMAFDSARDRIVLFGGYDGQAWLDDTWEYDGSVWTRVFPARSPLPRHQPVMAFDSLRNVCVLYGGESFGLSWNDTWEYDGVTWRQRAPAQPDPSPRTAAAMAFDSYRNRMVMFGGSSYGVALEDTWEYHFPYGYETWGSGCAGSQGVAVLGTQVTAPARLGTGLGLDVHNVPSGTGVFLITGLSTASWRGRPLPAELTAYGMPGCRLYVSVDTTQLALASGTSVDVTVQMPSDPMFLGFTLHYQALVLDPQAGNPLGAVTSNAGTAVIGN